MAETSVIEASVREGVGKGAARAARRAGYVPGVIYGGGKPPLPINIRHNVLMKELKAGRFLARLVTLRVDGEEHRVICREVQRDVVKGLPIHADFLRLSPRSRIEIDVPVEFVGHDECPGLRKGGVLTVVRSEVELRVRADNIPDHITVNLAGLEIGDVVRISMVELPEGATPTITDRDFMIANISPPTTLAAEEEEEEGLLEGAEAPAPEAETAEKKGEEEGD